MKIADILRHKETTSSGTVVTIAPGDSVQDLLAALAEHNVGALVVVDGANGARVAGIASERDIVRRLAEHGAGLLEQPVSAIMTTTVRTATSEDSVDSIAEAMTELRIRHMPVVDNGALRGIVSIGDVVSSRIRQLEHDRGQLEQYITG